MTDNHKRIIIIIEKTDSENRQSAWKLHKKTIKTDWRRNPQLAAGPSRGSPLECEVSKRNSSGRLLEFPRGAPGQPSQEHYHSLDVLITLSQRTLQVWSHAHGRCLRAVGGQVLCLVVCFIRLLAEVRCYLKLCKLYLSGCCDEGCRRTSCCEGNLLSIFIYGTGLAC